MKITPEELLTVMDEMERVAGHRPTLILLPTASATVDNIKTCESVGLKVRRT